MTPQMKPYTLLGATQHAARQLANERASYQPRLMTLTTKVLSTVGATTRHPQAQQ